MVFGCIVLSFTFCSRNKEVYSLGELRFDSSAVLTSGCGDLDFVLLRVNSPCILFSTLYLANLREFARYGGSPSTDVGPLGNHPEGSCPHFVCPNPFVSLPLLSVLHSCVVPSGGLHTAIAHMHGFDTLIPMKDDIKTESRAPNSHNFDPNFRSLIQSGCFALVKIRLGKARRGRYSRAIFTKDVLY